MDVKILKKKISDKFASLSGREKAIVLLILISLIVLVPYFYFYSPASTNALNKQNALQTLKAEVDTMNNAVSAQDVPQQDPSTSKLSLPEADDLSGMLAAISREANAAKVDFISIAPEGFIHRDKFIELKVKIELRVRFRQLYDFIKSIETKHKLFIIKDIKFETNNTVYPSGIALLHAVTYLKKK
jgi:Tfp pilus assembly protein PilO